MVHWPTQAAINQLTMRAATLALAFAATAAGLVAPSHAECLPGRTQGWCEIEQPYPPELLATADLTVTTQGLVLACDNIADSIAGQFAQSLVVSGFLTYAGDHYEYTINTMTVLLDCTTFVPLYSAYNTEPTSQCLPCTDELQGDFGPDFCPKTSAAGPMPAPGDE